MSTVQRALSSLAFMCLALTSSLAATEVLYVAEVGSILTYSVNKTTAEAITLNTLKTSYEPMQMLRSGPFLYVVGENNALEVFIYVYPVTAAGVPMKPVQTLSVKNQLSRFVIHPNGTIAYGMFVGTQNVHGTDETASDIVLFTIDPKTGKLTNTTKVLAKYPLSKSFTPDWIVMTPKGTKLYTQSSGLSKSGDEAITKYSYFRINAKIGTLGKTDWSWQDVFTTTQLPSTTFGDALTVQMDGKGRGIRVYPAGAKQDSKPMIECTSKMLAVCDDGANNIQLDPSGKYLTFDDFSIEEVPIVSVNTPAKRLQETDSIPGAVEGSVAFSSDESLVYAIEDEGMGPIGVFVSAFHSGKLMVTSTINVPAIEILPAK
jgi:hypothetical protein